MKRTVAFFPLRTNAYALLAGGPALSVVRRIKHASLLHDRVLCEAGTWRANAGPTGSTSFWTPPERGAEDRWQLPSERSRAQRTGFYLALGPSDSHTALRRVISSDSAEIAWDATLEPLRRDLPPSVDWIEFESFGLTNDGKRIARRLAGQDVADDWLASALREHWSRKLVSESAAHDLVLANGLGAVVSMDSRHGQVTKARVRRGVATVALGGRAQAVLLPNVADMSWHDLAAVRKDRGLRRLRAVLREVEAEALGGASSLSELDRRISTIFSRELAKVHSASALSPSHLTASVVGFVVGEGISAASAGVPVLGGLAGAAAGAVADATLRRSGRWVSTYRQAVST